MPEDYFSPEDLEDSDILSLDISDDDDIDDLGLHMNPKSESGVKQLNSEDLLGFRNMMPDSPKVSTGSISSELGDSEESLGYNFRDPYNHMLNEDESYDNSKQDVSINNLTKNSNNNTSSVSNSLKSDLDFEDDSSVIPKRNQETSKSLDSSDIEGLLDIEDINEEPEEDVVSSESFKKFLDFIKNYKKFIIIVVIILIALKLLFSLKSSDDTVQTETDVPNPEVVEKSRGENSIIKTTNINSSILNADSLVIDNTLYSSYIIPEKYLETKSNAVTPMVKGTTVDEITIAFPISLEEYNNLIPKEVYKIYYNKVNINNNIYIINPSLGGVIKNESGSN